ncbi:replicative DNA helicase [Frankia sp. R82]|uniref:replicative DNA helicase n=1 Tax=Frankia sp. R82 TaxID=2950553 RepID=UPI002043EEFF|nr:replicative DNA helicase [Frankia sp. R82]MCM3886118.1 replicative DNA helicase [Frankia sp. R82]
MSNNDLDHVPPRDLNAEQATLGAMTMSKDAVGDVAEIVRSGHDFYRPAHQTIYDTIVNLYNRGEPVDVIAVAAELSRRGELDRVGGPGYLHTLVEAVPTVANSGYYARIVAEKALFRRLLEAGSSIAQIGRTAAGTAAGAAEDADRQLHAALSAADNGDVPTSIGATANSFLEELESRGRDKAGLRGIPTGFADLDELTGGFKRGQMIVIAARPGVGKSMLALDIARAAAIKHNHPVLFVSLEMSRGELDQRVWAAEARVSHHNLETGNLTDDDWLRVARRMGETTDAPLFIDTAPNAGVAAIRTRARRQQRRDGLSLLIVDYLQLLVTAKKGENRQQEVSALSRELKLLAIELDVPVIALSQLNRASEQRADKRPQLSDLRDSGSIEQDADMVIMIYREDAHDPNSARAGEADLIVEKNRGGPKGTITVAFQGHYARFVDMAN